MFMLPPPSPRPTDLAAVASQPRRERPHVSKPLIHIRTPLCLTLITTACLAIFACASKPSQTQGSGLPSPPRSESTLARSLAIEAQRAEAARDIDKAISLYQRSVEADPDLHWSIWNNVGLLLMQKADFPSAGAAFRTAAEFPGSGSIPLENLGILYHQTGHDERALDAFLQALARNPRSIDAHRGALRASKRLHIVTEDALKRVEAALELEPDPTWRDIFMREKLVLQSRLAGQDAATSRIR